MSHTKTNQPEKDKGTPQNPSDVLKRMLNTPPLKKKKAEKKKKPG